MTSFALPTIQTPRILHKSSFLGKLPTTHHLPIPPHRPHRSSSLTPTAKFQLLELLGGRGLCNGEAGLQKELETPKQSPPEPNPSPFSPPTTSSFEVGEGAFEKELLGLTGGFPGGEKGLRQFVEKNPPPPKKKKEGGDGVLGSGSSATRPKAPELPLLMPGMIVIVKNESNPFHMYCGIVQRVTDGKAGVLFEGGNWDKLITFEISELERREKGPPMVNPKSDILEDLV